MEKQITIEKQKKLKNETMFNFKNVSLMKKQLFSLMMAFALVVGLSVSALAQTGAPTDPFFHVTNSEHSFEITNTPAVGSTVTWGAYLSDGTQVDADTDHISSWAVAGDNLSVDLTWATSASGLYYIQVTEATSESCTTIRRAFVYILSFDVLVYVSDEDGNNLEGADPYSECGEGTVANYGDLPELNGNRAFGQEVNIEGSGAVDGVLTDQTGTTTQSERFISLEIIWDAPAGFTSIFSPPAISYITYSATVTTNQAAGFNSIGDVTALTGTVTETTAQTGNLIFTSSILYDVRWGLDQEITVQALDVTLFDASDVRLGTELDTNETANGTADPEQNTTDMQIILGAPATSVIGVN